MQHFWAQQPHASKDQHLRRSARKAGEWPLTSSSQPLPMTGQSEWLNPPAPFWKDNSEAKCSDSVAHQNYLLIDMLIIVFLPFQFSLPHCLTRFLGSPTKETTHESLPRGLLIEEPRRRRLNKNFMLRQTLWVREMLGCICLSLYCEIILDLEFEKAVREFSCTLPPTSSSVNTLRPQYNKQNQDSHAETLSLIKL